MIRMNRALSIIMLAISMVCSTAIFARGEGGFNNEGDHGLNSNGFHNENNYNGYDNGFYYDKHLNDNNGVVILPGDSDTGSTCQTTQVCDSSGTCVTEQNCN